MINTTEKLFRASTRHAVHLFWLEIAILVFSCKRQAKYRRLYQCQAIYLELRNLSIICFLRLESIKKGVWLGQYI